MSKWENPSSRNNGEPQSDGGGDNHWLTRPATIRKLWWTFGIILLLTVLAQVFIPIKGKFPLESTFAFGAWFGFFCCVAMVLVARMLGWVLKRPEDYYSSTGIEPPPQAKDRSSFESEEGER